MTLSRRAFIQRLSFGSAGLTIGLQLQASSFAPADATEFTPDVFVTLEASGTVRIRCHRSEMGQGIRSTIPRLIADEMEADWNKVVVEQALGDAKYGDQNTDGSRSIRKNYDRLKRAGATVRTLLQQAAADTWQVAPDQVRIHNHAAHHADGKKTLGFGALVAKAANLPVPAADQLTLKPEKDYRYVMKKEWELLDGLDIVTGKAEYGYDVAVKDMKIALIARPPVVFGKVKSFDASETLKVPGVLEVVEMPALSPPAAFKMLGGIAVVAEHTWAAIQGREKLKIEWEDGPNAKYDTVAHQAEFEKALEDPKHVVRQHGNWQEAESQAESRLDAAYKVAGLAHATMEPLAATARLTDDGVEVWACTQTPQAAQANVMQTLEIPQEKANSVKVHVTLLGGGFGRKSKPDYVAEAAFLAHKTKRTIKVLWTREDEIQHGYYHSPSYQKLAATFQKGKLSGWYHAMVNHPIGATFNPAARVGGSADLGQGDAPYDVPHMRIVNGETDTFMRIGWLRSVTNINNAFAASSFADECAAHLKKDPLAFLLELIGPDRHIDLQAEGYGYGNYGETTERFPIDTARLKQVLNTVAKQAEWTRKRPKGHGLGIAVHRSFCSYVGAVIEVSMADNKLKIEDIHLAIDCGLAINPDRVHSQLEGAAMFAISNALYGQITAEKGRVVQSNFHDFPLARINQFPSIRTTIVSSDGPPGGVGEPGVPPVAPALCNAIFAASGKRYRDLPLSQFGIV